MFYIISMNLKSSEMQSKKAASNIKKHSIFFQFYKQGEKVDKKQQEQSPKQRKEEEKVQEHVEEGGKQQQKIAFQNQHVVKKIVILSFCKCQCFRINQFFQHLTLNNLQHLKQQISCSWYHNVLVRDVTRDIAIKLQSTIMKNAPKSIKPISNKQWVPLFGAQIARCSNILNEQERKEFFNFVRGLYGIGKRVWVTVDSLVLIYNKLFEETKIPIKNQSSGKDGRKTHDQISELRRIITPEMLELCRINYKKIEGGRKRDLKQLLKIHYPKYSYIWNNYIIDQIVFEILKQQIQNLKQISDRNRAKGVPELMRIKYAYIRYITFNPEAQNIRTMLASLPQFANNMEKVSKAIIVVARFNEKWQKQCELKKLGIQITENK